MSTQGPQGATHGFKAAALYILTGATGGDLKTASPLSIAPPTAPRVRQNESTQARNNLSSQVASPILSNIKENNDIANSVQHKPVPPRDSVPLRAAKTNNTGTNALHTRPPVPQRNLKPELKPREHYVPGAAKEKARLPVASQNASALARPVAEPAVTKAQGLQAAAQVKGQILADIKSGNKSSKYTALVGEMSGSMAALNKKDFLVLQGKDFKASMDKEGKLIRDDNNPLFRIRDRCGSMNHLGAEMLLDPSLKPKERGELAKFFIDCAETSLKAGDVNGAYAFLAPLKTMMVERLADGKEPKLPINAEYQTKMNKLYENVLKSPSLLPKLQQFVAKQSGLADNIADAEEKKQAEEKIKTTLQNAIKERQNEIQLNQTPKSIETFKAATSLFYEPSEIEDLEKLSYDIKPRKQI